MRLYAFICLHAAFLHAISLHARSEAVSQSPEIWYAEKVLAETRNSKTESTTEKKKELALMEFKNKPYYTEQAETPFCREERLIGEEAFSRLQAAHVAVFGLGGVGSYAAEALCRGGIGRLSLIDADTVSVSNLNRQLCALSSTLGKPKTEVTAARLLEINPALSGRLHLFRRFVLPENAAALLDELSAEAPLDYVVDAVDTVSAKIALAGLCEARGIPLLSCCGTGNKLDPSRFRISELAKTSVCPLCKVLRRELKARGVRKLNVCWSDETPRKTESRTPASISFVPGAAGLMIAGYVIREIAAL